MGFSHLSALILSLNISSLLFYRAALGATFTFVNKCEYSVWPGILANSGSPALGSTGFKLPKDSTRSLIAPSGWSGRFWGRTGCAFTDDGSGFCQTGDCGTGQTECNGSGAAPPATLAEFTLGTSGLDFYDVSLVDGYNLPMIVEAAGGSGLCASTGCVTDLNRVCPSELRVDGGEGCRSACEAFGTPEYCCSGAFNSPNLCRPSVYSKLFKTACPRSYSYAYDDPTSTFTCSGADYTVTFCPSMPSQKSSNDPTPTMATPATSKSNDEGTVAGTDTMGMGGSEPVSGLGVSGSDPYAESGSAMFTDRTWMAGLAMGRSSTSSSPFLSVPAFIASTILFLAIFYG